MSADAARLVMSICEELGFSGAGIAEASPSRWGREFREWLAAEKHGSMEYLARHVEERLNPARVLPGAKAIIMVADTYETRESRGPRVRQDGGGLGRIARYARGSDYHVVMKRRLHALCDRLRDELPEGEFRAFVDTAPILEREHASRAGLGWVGKHTLLIHPRRGSWMLLGGVLTTLELPPSADPVPDHCGTCTRCIEACPTGAISPYSVDASRCISYLTIERRLPIDAGFHRAIGDWLFGCDICQEVCPHNSARADPGGPVRPEYEPRREGLSVLEVLGWREVDRRAAFAGSALKRATLAMMKRNALIVAGNLARPEAAIVERIRMVAKDESEPAMVREAAGAVLSSLESRSTGA